ncbi:MAG: methyltransferase domain-containing protein [Pseudomonadota bacterium]
MDKTLYAYNKNARRYADKFMGYPSYRRILEQFADAYINPGASVLDIGCGPGHNARLILDRIPRTSVTGIDLSESMLAIAKPLVPEDDQTYPWSFFEIVPDFFVEDGTWVTTLSQPWAGRAFPGWDLNRPGT